MRRDPAPSRPVTHAVHAGILRCFTTRTASIIFLEVSTRLKQESLNYPLCIPKVLLRIRAVYVGGTRALLWPHSTDNEEVPESKA